MCLFSITLGHHMHAVWAHYYEYYVHAVSVSSPAGCPFEGMRYYNASDNECAPCFGTCDRLIVPCPAICRSGCACPPGTVLHERRCIPVTECPKKGETPYNRGQTSRCDCNTLSVMWLSYDSHESAACFVT